MFVNSGGGGGGPSPSVASNTQQTITTGSAHGFVAGDIVRQDGAGWSKSIASSSTPAEVYGVVQSAPTANTFVLITNGLITIPGAFVAGQTYFLSDAVAGTAVTSSPTNVGSVTKPVLLGIDANTALVVAQMRGEVIAGAVTNIAGLYWVATNGNDTTGDGTILQPFLTIQKAHDQALLDWTASDYVQINIGPGVYTGNTLVTRARTVFSGGAGTARSNSVTITGQFQIQPNTATSLLDTISCQGIHFIPAGSHAGVRVNTTGMFSLLLENCWMQTTSSSKSTVPLNVNAGHASRPYVELRNCVLSVDSAATGPAAIDGTGTFDLYLVQTEVRSSAGGESGIDFASTGLLNLWDVLVETSADVPSIYVVGTQPGSVPKVISAYSDVRNLNSAFAGAHTFQIGTAGVTVMLVHNVLTATSATANVVRGDAATVSLLQGANLFTTSNNSYNMANVTKTDLGTTFTGV